MADDSAPGNCGFNSGDEVRITAGFLAGLKARVLTQDEVHFYSSNAPRADATTESVWVAVIIFGREAIFCLEPDAVAPA